jgi:opacity protein-like surface antigen
MQVAVTTISKLPENGKTSHCLRGIGGSRGLSCPAAEGKPSSYIPSVSVEAEGWSFAYQLGVGLLIGLSENVPSDIGYRLKVIPNVDVDDPVFCVERNAIRRWLNSKPTTISTFLSTSLRSGLPSAFGV